ncbi:MULTISPECIES: branched-chain-amino-acid transaminase [Bacillus cereus group]|uniref:Branched-chain-amino-acid aminotransferase n=1 Tax=Bacillus toyonensis TaxID=155322 RepID=A0A2B5DJZ6_9BACI|nr:MULTISPECIES: branched-chain-amino-acid transaminase [Bacillus cereus group]KNH34442.1 branched-chain amino acid aminotransferase [Bacillus thuringiensis]EJQ90439.1 branched-chain amino acid aminotransferase [Bacillus toyonensis]EJR61046.1 branched-chain amino acid aminotransferase [Bacillus toyonensis]MBC2683067.1 branched-chain-amino-acid transaminase [Bacillus toyonensis]MBJ8046438.1 branched-chain-amino-acid transaminase [Bacillus cereus group sp. N18]
MGNQYIYMNGEFVEKEKAVVSVYDHGFLYGDGVFEGIRSYGGNVFCLKEHVKRLYESAKSILLTIPMPVEEMEEAVLQTLQKNEYADAYIRLIVSRGKGDLGLDPRSCVKPSVIIIAEQLKLFPQEFYDNGLSVVSVASRRNTPDALDPRIKSMNYLNNVLVKIEAAQAGVLEALMLNQQGYVCEGSGDNVFIVKDGKVLTPPSYLGALEGITRNSVIELCERLNISYEERPFTRHDVYVADEVFLTGTAAELIPVVKVDSREIGDGKPGSVTKRLTEEFKKLTRERGVRVPGLAESLA